MSFSDYELFVVLSNAISTAIVRIYHMPDVDGLLSLCVACACACACVCAGACAFLIHMPYCDERREIRVHAGIGDCGMGIRRGNRDYRQARAGHLLLITTV